MIGYCCINTTLRDRGITSNRGMKKATFSSKGIRYASELALLNLKDMLEILRWNAQNNILLYRMSSDIFPWMSEYQIKDLPNYEEILSLCKIIGFYSLENKMRLTFHPGQFNVLASDNPKTVRNTIYELNQHSQIMDMMGLSHSPYNCINIHVNTTKGGKIHCLDRFITEFRKLDIGTKSRLTVENDDKPNGYSIEDLYYLYSHIAIPIIFDQHHYRVGAKGSHDEYTALSMALSTWGLIKPLTHISSSKRDYEDSTARSISHADYIYEQIYNPNGYDFDTDIEAKAKELAVLKYIKDYEK